eukprot:TRINITY_DN21911_c0_g1_i1.p1 TRINITY_DN21911_c0_g1~~TRINITY_DN21911_c0_g1_i1.p1  ORF type:complete len:261 (-),score=2.43 TRINITY_DN21911_c0_g1_i1:153-935(-)
MKGITFSISISLIFLVLSFISGDRADRRSALVIVDVQKCFLTGGSLQVPKGEEVIPVINRLRNLPFDLIVLSQDWHPKNHISFADMHPGHSVFQTVNLTFDSNNQLCQPAWNLNRSQTPQCQGATQTIEQTLWPRHCVAHETDSEFHPDLIVQPSDVIIQKGTNQDIDSYSAFADNIRSASTGLEAVLKQRGITQVFVTGLAYEYCVAASVMDAVSVGLTTYFIEDASRSITPEGQLLAHKEMLSRGVTVLTSDQVKSKL